jgi:hypothetical protein
VSHQILRKETNCLNCGSQVNGRYCSKCGQENIEPKQNFWSLFTHFIYDVFHFDGKFFDTLRFLLFKPGFVPKEYTKGKRQSYLDPIRMYLFTSAVFFLVFFSITDPGEAIDITSRHQLNRMERYNFAASANNNLHHHPGDTNLQKQIKLVLDTSYNIYLLKDSIGHLTDTTFPVIYNGNNYLFRAEKSHYTFKSNSDWIGRMAQEKWKAFKEKYGDDQNAIIKELIRSFLHKLPYILFVSLPFFALLLKLLYIRRKDFYYSDHAVFTLYHYIFSFLVLLVFFILNKIQAFSGWEFLSFFDVVLFLLGGLYLLIAMRRFYNQSWKKTITKFFILNFLGLVIFGLLMLVFIIFSFIQL